MNRFPSNRRLADQQLAVTLEGRSRRAAPTGPRSQIPDTPALDEKVRYSARSMRMTRFSVPVLRTMSAFARARGSSATICASRASGSSSTIRAVPVRQP